jgi:hypothetical protein
VARQTGELRAPQASLNKYTADVRALTNKQYIQASRVAAVLSFNRNMPRAPHGAPVLGAPRTANRQEAEPKGPPKQALDLAVGV